MPENRNNPFQGKRIALVHDWLNGMRGGEKCLEVLCEIFPDATPVAGPTTVKELL